MELSDSNLDNSDDFYVMNSQSVRDDSKTNDKIILYHDESSGIE